MWRVLASDGRIFAVSGFLPIPDPATMPAPICPNCNAKVWHVRAHWEMRAGYSCSALVDPAINLGNGNVQPS